MRRELDRWLLRNPLPSDNERKGEYFASMPPTVKREWEIQKARESCEKPNYNIGLAERALKRMNRVDAMPRDIREVVYEYGLEIVQEFLSHGVTRASSIRHLIGTVLHEDINGQPRFKINKNAQSPRNPAERG